MTDAELVKKAIGAMGNAYAPYSRYKVGAAVLTSRGEIFTGANVENASYGLTVCAERTAVFNAVTHGHRKIAAVAVVVSKGGRAVPCGACLQVLAEFGRSVRIILADRKGGFGVTTLGALLPAAFRLKP
jgi:cytidine deaminase